MLPARLRGSWRRPDVTGLKDFSLASDRDSTPFFKGRADEIGDIRNLCVRALKSMEIPGKRETSATRLVIGAPGAGKTSFLRHLPVLSRDREAGFPLPVFMNSESLCDEGRFVLDLALQVSPGKAAELRKTYERVFSAGIGYSTTGLKGGRSVKTDALSPGFSALREIFPPRQWRRPVLLAVDEIQSVNKDARHVMRILHEGIQGFPVIPVYAGLGSAQEMFRAYHLTRLSAGNGTVRLGSLSCEDAQTAVSSMLDGFGVEKGNAESFWVRCLGRISEGWPQHLHNGMRALAGCLAGTEGRLEDVSADRVLVMERTYRRETYESRISGRLRQCFCLVSSVMASRVRRDSGRGS